MKIYTKTGDRGETSLFGNRRVPKDSLRIEAYGTVDELNSIVGICRSVAKRKKIDTVLARIQKDLFVVGTDLATPEGASRRPVRRISAAETTRLEQFIDEIDRQLPPLKNFILPGGDLHAAMVHFARTVCRRAERLCVRLTREEKINAELIVYLNRLSDLLFVLARWCNALGRKKETLWKA